MTVSISGGDRLKRLLKQAGKAGQPAAEKALYQQGQSILAKTIPRTPRQYGPLRNSGHVTLPSGGVVEIRFGGPSAPYAMIVHEDPDARHKVGEYKFLEKTVTQERDVAFDAVAAAVRSVIGRAS